MIKMRSKKGTVLFALFPGAGHMFNGFMKLGLSFMALFWFIILFSGWARMDVLALLLPLVWFWSFMDCINRRFIDEAEFYAQEDQWLFSGYYNLSFGKISGRVGLLIGVFLILVGLYALFCNFIMPMLPEHIEDYLWHLTYDLPEAILAIIVIVVGVFLITGRKKKMMEQVRAESWQNDDFSDAM